VRQRPGLKNALGAINFAMLNPMDIYLHSTPTREVFKRSRRDLSHGCIRVEHPTAMAQYVLGQQRQWNADTIQDVRQPGPTPATLPGQSHFRGDFLCHGHCRQ